IYNININDFVSELKLLLGLACQAQDIVIVTGDINVHFENNNLSTTVLKEVMTSFGLLQMVPLVPTHIAGHTLDLLFGNPSVLPIEVENNICSVGQSDHFPVLYNFHILNSISSQGALRKKQNVAFRNVKDVDVVSFEQNLTCALDEVLQEVFHSENSTFQVQYELFCSIQKQLLDSVAPLKYSKINSHLPKWMDNEFRTERASRRRLERAYLRTKSITDKNLLVQQRNRCAELSKLKRYSYFTRALNNCGSDQRALFQIVSTMLSAQNNKVAVPEHENDKCLAQTFNTFYFDKVYKIRQNLPAIRIDNCIFNLFSGSFLTHFKEATIEEIDETLSKVNIKTSVFDPLPTCILNKVYKCLLPYFCQLINKSFHTGSLDGIKQSVIHPLLKKSGLDPNILKNYRPISNLPFVSKLMERLVLNRLNAHMQENDLHIRYQHGYKKHHSTETALLTGLDDILIGFEKGLATVVVMIDLSAAFDTVDIPKLLNVLKFDLGIRDKALDWFEAFLTKRSQTVIIGSDISDPLPVLFGVPQVQMDMLMTVMQESLFHC
ncbi:hypothetical protein SNEBB_008503, partial [Seison nebaliae]